MKLKTKRRKPRKIAKCPELYKVHDKLNIAYVNGAGAYVNMAVLNQQFNSTQGLPLRTPLPERPINVRAEINAVRGPLQFPSQIKSATERRQYVEAEGKKRIESILIEWLKDVPNTTYVHRCDQFPDLSSLPYQFVVWIDFGITIRAMTDCDWLYPYAEGYKLDREGKKNATHMFTHTEQLVCIGCGPDFDRETMQTVLALIK